MTAPRYPSTVVERFLRYVTFDTRSVEGAERFPSSDGQLVLLRRLDDELRELGVEDVEMDRHGYVFATLPPSAGCEDVPPIGFVAHVDTSPEMPGDGVEPILHRAYRGQDLVLPGAPDAVLRAGDDPALAEQIGHDVITASGRTLLGADDKAGVAEIMAAAEVLLGNPALPRGPVRVGFTPDEEIGRGTQHFDVERFGARCAYTLDGGPLGELQVETFSADTLIAEFHGFNTHPGYAKGKMVNALKLASRFIAALPADRLSPETTEGHAGYVHPYRLEGGVERARVTLLLRDFRTAALGEHERVVREAAERAVAEAGPRARVEIRVEPSYRNMKEVLDRHPEVVEAAREAIRRAGLTPRETPIRGGTDGSRLCFMGLPTPNLFAGEHNFHSRLEWTSSRELHKAVEVIVELCRVWSERTRDRHRSSQKPNPT